MIQDIIVEKQDMRYLDWAVKKLSPETPGCFLKAYEECFEKKCIISFPIMISKYAKR